MRDVVVGGSGRLQIAIGKNAPRRTDKFMEHAMFDKQKAFDRDHVDEGNLDRPQAGGRAYGPHKGHTTRSSVYTRAALSPVLSTIAFAAA